MKIFLTLSYIGTDFCGYQVQPNARTVQGELNAAAQSLFGFECDITGCSRTDTGVHANTFCATITKKGCQCLETNMDIGRVPLALNAHLPCDIAVKDARYVSEDFHPRYDVKHKEYVYRIYNSQTRSPLEHGRAWHIPYIFSDADIERMNNAAKIFVGTHDFSAFMASGSTVESTVRTVSYAKVDKNGDIITFTVAADGFLYNMVRIMTGTLADVGKGKIAPSDISEIIASCDRKRAGMTAPPHGLYLNNVVY